VVVTGATAVTRFLVEILRAKGLSPVVVAAPGPWADWLLAKGCAVVGDAAGVRADGGGAADAAAITASVASAIAAQGLGTRPLRLIATGDLERAASLAGPRATLTVLAPGSPLAGALIDREVTVVGVAGPHPDLIVEAAAMCVKGEIDLAGGVGEGETFARADML
jgi:hypothetical protein